MNRNVNEAWETGKAILGIWVLVAVVTVACIIASPLIILAGGVLVTILLILGFAGLMATQGGWVAMALAVAFVGYLLVDKL